MHIEKYSTMVLTGFSSSPQTLFCSLSVSPDRIAPTNTHHSCISFCLFGPPLLTLFSALAGNQRLCICHVFLCSAKSGEGFEISSKSCKLIYFRHKVSDIHTSMWPLAFANLLSKGWIYYDLVILLLIWI